MLKGPQSCPRKNTQKILLSSVPGNMAKAIITGLLHAGYNANRIKVADTSPTALEAMRLLNIESVSQSAAEIVTDVDLIVLAVKPQGNKQCARLSTRLYSTKSRGHVCGQQVSP